MSEAYKSCGYRVLINTRVGVGAHNTEAQVSSLLSKTLNFPQKCWYLKFVETSNDGERDWGAHVKKSDKDLKNKRNTVLNITIVRIAEFINNVVGRRIIKKKGAVVMKLDVEVWTMKYMRGWLYWLNIKGLEVDVLADLIHSGAFQHLDYIYVDFHPRMDGDHKSFRY